MDKPSFWVKIFKLHFLTTRLGLSIFDPKLGNPAFFRVYISKLNLSYYL